MPQIRLRLDPWPTDYESAFQVDELEAETVARIRTDVESVEWRAVEPKQSGRPDVICFVDGVLRTDARVIADDGSQRINHGLLGSIAAGAVRVEKERASFCELRVRRFSVIGNGVLPEPQSLLIGKTELQFEPYSVMEGNPNAPRRGLQNLMRTEEASIAQSLTGGSHCVFADGPLTFFLEVNLPIVGVIKRLVDPYLSAPDFALVSRLDKGQRTPVFEIMSTGHNRYSWYLRVAEPRAMDHAAAGVLRLEVRSGVGLERAVKLADLSASCLPAFAGESFRDPRSPQNLLPVGALEHELRHRLGDPMAIRRAIEREIFRLSAQ